MISSKESEAIARYKDYAAKHLPQVDTLSGLWAPDFEYSFYSQNETLDEIDALKYYLLKLEPYAKILSRAAYLRQFHFDEFVVDEDDGHRAWRVGMNMVAQDARDKVEKWSGVWEQKLDKVIREYTPTLSKIKQFAHIKNVDKVKESKTAVRPPRMSKKERRKRKRARERMDDEALKEAFVQLQNEGVKLIETEVENTTFLETHKEYTLIEILNNVLSANRSNARSGCSNDKLNSMFTTAVPKFIKKGADDTMLLYIIKAMLKPFFIKSALHKKLLLGRTAFTLNFIDENRIYARKDLYLKALTSQFGKENDKNELLGFMLVAGMFKSWKEIVEYSKDAPFVCRIMLFNYWPQARLWFLEYMAKSIINLLNYAPMEMRPAILEYKCLYHEIMETTTLVDMPKNILRTKILRSKLQYEKRLLVSLKTQQNCIRALLLEK